MLLISVDQRTVQRIRIQAILALPNLIIYPLQYAFSCSLMGLGHCMTSPDEFTIQGLIPFTTFSSMTNIRHLITSRRGYVGLLGRVDLGDRLHFISRMCWLFPLYQLYSSESSVSLLSSLPNDLSQAAVCR